MKLLFSALLLVFLSSCQEDPKVREEQQQKEAQKREAIFNNINNGWNFNSTPSNEASRELTKYWAEWRVFLNELGQKPKSSISAFQQKAKTLSKRALELNNNIPVKYNLPEVKSRIAVITTKVNAINLYIHLGQIPDKKIVQLAQEINTELASMNAQLEEIKRRGEIKMEEGEADMIRMLDTARAIPNEPKNVK
ncbi:hypothetical protein [Flavobacterium wongokense]|uniref:hypothetical protein n=1 Tax=Flavobacterium wongokense TaxID=2910674 RepID=UPI001F3C7830|nr:hypothetical protein [Flavobacterium sp. WG47]MCF6131588.1 hypothetical protein [Flavobacterium sp. WG47]